MRFPAAVQPQPPTRYRAPAESRQVAAAQPKPEPALAPAHTRDELLPAALDERVRLIGEW